MPKISNWCNGQRLVDFLGKYFILRCIIFHPDVWSGKAGFRYGGNISAQICTLFFAVQSESRFFYTKWEARQKKIMNQSSKHFFSVIIPTINEEKYLPRLLGDLTKQAEPDFEVIVVDGGSTDATLRKLRYFKHSLPLLLQMSKKANVSLQRNSGALPARGKYLVFLDAVVRIPADFLLRLKAQLLRIGTDYATTRYRADQETFLDQGLTIIGSWGMQFSVLVAKPFFSGQCIIIKSNIFKKLHGFDKSITHAEDCDLVQRAAKAGFIRSE